MKQQIPQLRQRKKDSSARVGLPPNQQMESTAPIGRVKTAALLHLQQVLWKVDLAWCQFWPDMGPVIFGNDGPLTWMALACVEKAHARSLWGARASSSLRLSDRPLWRVACPTRM